MSGTQRLTKRQAAIIGAYTGVLVGAFPDLHEYVEELLGRPVFTHELGGKRLTEDIKHLAKVDLLNIVNVGDQT